MSAATAPSNGSASGVKGVDPASITTMRLFLRRALEAVHKEAGSSRKSASVKAAAATALKSPLITDKSAPTSTGPEALQETFLTALPALRLAAASKTPKMVIPALDCIQKLIAYGYLTSEAVDPEDPSKLLMETVVGLICECFDKTAPDDQVSLQIVKALLQAVQSPNSAVHGLSLTSTLRVAYEINLESRSPIVQVSARATLTQMLHTIFDRMESSGLGALQEAVPQTEDEFPETPSAAAADSADTNDNASPTPPPADQTPEQLVSDVVNTIITNVVSSNSSPSAAGTNTAPATTNGQDHPPSASSTTTPGSPAPSASSTAHTPASSPSLPLRNGEGAGDSGEAFTDVLQRDAFLVYRALCKLSVKPVAADAAQDAPDMRNKLLSLELLYNIHQHSGVVFRSHPHFADAVKQYLVVSLLKNAVSPHAEVLASSLRIFLTLVEYFKVHLKTEIGVFFNNVFLRLLESPNTALQHKYLVLQVLNQICQDSQTLVDIYLNYDCDLDSTDIFERIVSVVSRMTLGKEAGAWAHAEDQAAVRKMATVCIESSLSSLLDWVRSSDDVEADLTVGPGNETTVTSDTLTDPAASPTEIGDSSVVPEMSFELPADPHQFERAKARKQMMETGIAKFNEKPKRGINFFVDQGWLQRTPDDVARFFMQTEGLDKAKIGEFMGEGDEFNVSVLYAYVEQLDFSGMEFDIAIRHFLSGFRLPGESQKIDRMMEKFAERYLVNNPGTFSCADTAYVLAFSVIMLATDAHSIHVRNKMTLEGFLRNNKKIDQGQDLPHDYQARIYERIVAEELKLKDDGPAPPSKNGGKTNAKQAQNLFLAESEAMVARTQEAFREKAKARPGVFYTATHPSHVGQMVAQVWAPILASLSVTLEEAIDDEMVDTCVAGLTAATRLACEFYLETQRDAFLTALAKFTSLHAASQVGYKNLASIKAVLEIADTEGDYLADSWSVVLRCISQLEAVRLIGVGAVEDSVFVASGNNPAALPSAVESPAAKSSGGKSVTRRRSSVGLTPAGVPAGSGPSGSAGANGDLDDSMVSSGGAGAIAGEIDEGQIERIFRNSRALSSEAIVDFVRHITAISLEELSGARPRIFLLKKTVEIAADNMDRIRLVWSRVWTLFAAHFMTVCTSNNEGIALFAIDSLRQLAMKFLEKEELANYHFQKEFLRPFNYVVVHSPLADMRELVLECLTNMFRARAANIRSGWKSMLAGIGAAAKDREDRIVKTGFNMISSILTDHFSAVVDNGAFTDVVNCLVSYAAAERAPSIASAALDWLQFCVDELSKGSVPESKDGDKDGGGEAGGADDHTMEHWIPLLLGLSRATGQANVDVRHKALDVMFGVLRAHGDGFSMELWDMIFKAVLAPLFDPIMQDEAVMDEEEREWLHHTAQRAMLALMELMASFPAVAASVSESLISLIRRAVMSMNELLARIGVAALTQLLVQGGGAMDDGVLDGLVRLIGSLFKDTMPHELLTFAGVASAVDAVAFEERRAGSEEPKTESESENEGNGSKNNSAFSTPVVFGKKMAQRPKAVAANEADAAQDATAPAQGATLPNHGLSFPVVKSKCVLQLRLVSSVSDFVAAQYERLTTEQLVLLLGALESSYEFAHEFNKNLPLRMALYKAGFMEHLPNLIKQETNGVMAYLKVLFRLYGDTETDVEERRSLASKRMFSLSKTVIQTYISKGLSGSPKAEEQREAAAWTPILVLIVKSVQEFPDEQFSANLPGLYPVFVELMLSDNRELRQGLYEIFRRVGTTFKIDAPHDEF